MQFLIDLCQLALVKMPELDADLVHRGCTGGTFKQAPAARGQPLGWLQEHLLNESGSGPQRRHPATSLP